MRLSFVPCPLPPPSRPRCHVPATRPHRLPRILPRLQWDVSYWAERLKEAKYALEEEQLRPYFALPNVLEVRWAWFASACCTRCVRLVLAWLQPVLQAEMWQDPLDCQDASIELPRSRHTCRATVQPCLPPHPPHPPTFPPLQGLFGLAKRLFDVDIEPADGQVPVWHEDVRFFCVKKVGPGRGSGCGRGLVCPALPWSALGALRQARQGSSAAV